MKVYIGSAQHKKVMAFDLDYSQAKELMVISNYGDQYKPAAIKSFLINNSTFGEPIFKKLVKCICCGEIDCNCMYPNDVVVTFDEKQYQVI